VAQRQSGPEALDRPLLTFPGRGAMDAGPDPRRDVVVVGVDGSEGGTEALRWAVGQARILGGALEVCSFWHVPQVSSHLAAYDYHQLADGAREALEKALSLAGELDSMMEVRGVTERMVPASGLVRESTDAGLLVVGSRGLGGFRGLLLGSVSRYCLEHARCPVLIVRPRGRHDGPRHEAHRRDARRDGGRREGAQPEEG
jgi:nucleotide-binding universal stress UspA family protein